MDPALWLLVTLRFHAALRKIKKTFSTVKGAILAAVGLAIFSPQLLSVAFMPTIRSPAIVENIRRFGPLTFLLYALLIVFTSASEKAIYFQPAEVDFLFPAPFSRRRLLWYKVGVQLLSCLAFGTLMAAFFCRFVPSIPAAILGSILAVSFLQLLAVAIGLAASTAGAMARSRGRKLVLAGLAAVALLGLYQATRGMSALDPLEALLRLERSAAVKVALSPLRCFIELIVADRVWPGVLLWGAACLAIDGALLALIFGLDAQYLESAAVTSAKVYDQIQRMRKGGGFGAIRGRSGKVRKSVMPTLPWWGGAGPVAWRQLATAQRDVARPITAFIVFAWVLFPTVLIRYQGKDLGTASLGMLATLLGMGLLVSTLLPFDFRSDFDRLAELKALPVSPTALAAGQIVAPFLVMTSLQALAAGGLAVIAGDVDWIFWAFASFAIPLNLALFGVDNLWAVLFPSRPIAAGTFDVQAMGRAILQMLAKFLLLSVSLGLSSAIGALVYYLTGQALAPALAVGWVLTMLISFVPVPFIALAFRKLDVARDTPT